MASGCHKSARVRPEVPSQSADHFRHTRPPPNQRGPLLGEHSSEVLRDEAKPTNDDIAELVIDDVVRTLPISGAVSGRVGYLRSAIRQW